MKLTVNDGNVQLPNEGSPIATLRDIIDEGERPNPYEPGQMRHRVRLIWGIPGTDGSTIEQWDFQTASLHRKANLFKIAKALLGTTPAGTIEMADLIGKQAILEIEHYTNNAGQKRAKIVTYRPVKAGKSGTNGNTNLHGITDISDDDLPENLR